MVSEAEVLERLRDVMHPEIQQSLVSLRLIRGITIHIDQTVTVGLALPFKEIPIKDDLVHSVQEAVGALDPHLSVNVEPY